MSGSPSTAARLIARTRPQTPHERTDGHVVDRRDVVATITGSQRGNVLAGISVMLKRRRGD
jgi:hypothetical protein